MDNPEWLSCTIQLGTNVGRYQCSGRSISELKDQATMEFRTLTGLTDWDVAELVCKEDGSEIRDMESLADHLKKGHREFCLLNSTLISYVRAINLDQVARLYREVTDLSGMSDDEKENMKAVGAKIRENIMQWTIFRRDDLQLIGEAHDLNLAAKLEQDSLKVSNWQNRILDALNATQDDSAGQLADPLGSDSCESDGEDTEDVSD